MSASKVHLPTFLHNILLLIAALFAFLGRHNGGASPSR
jgi:hypothetical protein